MSRTSPPRRASATSGHGELAGAEARPVRGGAAARREGEAADGDQPGAGRPVGRVGLGRARQAAPGGGERRRSGAGPAASSARDGAQRGERRRLAVGLLEAEPGVARARARRTPPRWGRRPAPRRTVRPASTPSPRRRARRTARSQRRRSSARAAPGSAKRGRGVPTETDIAGQGTSWPRRAAPGRPPPRSAPAPTPTASAAGSASRSSSAMAAAAASSGVIASRHGKCAGGSVQSPAPLRPDLLAHRPSTSSQTPTRLRRVLEPVVGLGEAAAAGVAAGPLAPLDLGQPRMGGVLGPPHGPAAGPGPGSGGRPGPAARASACPPRGPGAWGRTARR